MTAAKDNLPVDNFTDAYPFLRRPFTPAAIRFKVQATWDGGAMCIAYIDARLVSGRLNHVCPAIWSPEFVPHPSDKGLICKLTVDGITRTDYGQSDYENAKGDFSDALKRAAVHFGIGESLYVLPRMVVKEGNLLKKISGGSGKPKYRLQPAGENYCRTVYTDWLEQFGTQAFGEPLDHGDTLEPEPEPEPDTPSPLGLLSAAADKADVPQDMRREIGRWIHADGEMNSARATSATLAINAGAVGDLLEDIGKAA